MVICQFAAGSVATTPVTLSASTKARSKIATLALDVKAAVGTASKLKNCAAHLTTDFNSVPGAVHRESVIVSGVHFPANVR